MVDGSPFPLVLPQQNLELQGPSFILVLPRIEAQQRIPLAGEVCISITSPRQNRQPPHEAYADVLRLKFDDIEEPCGQFTLMSAADAHSILQFCWKHRNAPLTVHCDHGASRAAAIGLFVAEWLGRPLELRVKAVVPNGWVTAQMKRMRWRCAAGWLGWGRSRFQLRKMPLEI